MIAQPRCAWSHKSHARINAEQAERESTPEWIKAIFGTGSPNLEDMETVLALGAPAGELFFECELVDPPSGRYKAVYVHVPPEQVLALLKLCRDAASEQRANAMHLNMARTHGVAAQGEDQT